MRPENWFHGSHHDFCDIVHRKLLETFSLAVSVSLKGSQAHLLLGLVLDPFKEHAAGNDPADVCSISRLCSANLFYAQPGRQAPAIYFTEHSVDHHILLAVVSCLRVSIACCK